MQNMLHVQSRQHHTIEKQMDIQSILLLYFVTALKYVSLCQSP